MVEKIDLVSLPKKSFWKLSIPIIAFCVFDAVYGLVDMAWISQISVEALFAVGVSIPFVTLVYSFGDSIGQGTNSIMSRFVGADDYESAYNALIHGMVLANILWFSVVLVLLFTHGILIYMETSQSYSLIFDYLVPLVVFSYIFMFNNLFSETLQAEGNSTTPTVLIIVSNILNMILDPIFIFNLNLGLKGAAYATVLSAVVVFIPVLYLYLSGRTKVPMSFKYFNFRPYIIIEIFKVALPNFLDNAVWCISASFINTTLLSAMGSIGPVLYSVSNKLKTLLISPVRGYGRGLMSVTGHLFGAQKFDEISAMFKYVLKVSLITMIPVMIIFSYFAQQLFSLFSINGFNTEIFWISICGIVIMVSISFSMISSKMLDGFGKSMYSLLFTVLKIVFEIALIYMMDSVLHNASSVLIAIMVSEAIVAAVYYVFLRHLFKNFKKEYKNKATVKTFKKDEKSIGSEKLLNNKPQKKMHLIIALVLAIIFLVLVMFMAFRTGSLIGRLTRVVAVAVFLSGTYLMGRLNRPIFSVLGFVILSFILSLLMGRGDYFISLLLIVSGVLVLYLRGIFKSILVK